MRNGNYFQVFVYNFYKLHPFYPTYEEWKLVMVCLCSPALNTFYPTYEEWKQFMHLDKLQN